MAVLVKNVSLSVRLSLTALRLVGYWPPGNLGGSKRFLYDCYGFFTLMFLLGSYLVSQMVDMFQIWGNLPMMTGVAFVMFTNIAQLVKILNLVGRRRLILGIIDEADEVLRAVDGEEEKEIVKSCNREISLQQLIFACLTFVTMLGWATSAEKGKLPLRAWYPYDWTKSPAYELSYLHQIGALYVAAFLNVSKDTLVTSLVAQCRCRLRLLALSLRTLCSDLKETEKKVLSGAQEEVCHRRLGVCVRRHHTALQAARQLQDCFSEPVFVQFIVSLGIICVTAFQLVSGTCFLSTLYTAQGSVLVFIVGSASLGIKVTGNPVRLIAMGTYLLNMMFQVFIYCYQGNQLSEESIKIAGAVYDCPWYTMSMPLKRSLLIVMVRSQRVAKITAGGFTTLSLTSFMAIIKTSYSMFTLLQQLEM